MQLWRLGLEYLFWFCLMCCIFPVESRKLKQNMSNSFAAGDQVRSRFHIICNHRRLEIRAEINGISGMYLINVDYNKWGMALVPNSVSQGCWLSRKWLLDSRKRYIMEDPEVTMVASNFAHEVSWSEHDDTILEPVTVANLAAQIEAVLHPHVCSERFLICQTASWWGQEAVWQMKALTTCRTSQWAAEIARSWVLEYCHHALIRKPHVQKLEIPFINFRVCYVRSPAAKSQPWEVEIAEAMPHCYNPTLIKPCPVSHLFQLEFQSLLWLHMIWNTDRTCGHILF